jgi:hypothetical protein
MPECWLSSRSKSTSLNFSIGFVRLRLAPLQPPHHAPDFVQGVLVSCPFAALEASDLALEVVVVDLFVQGNKHLRPNRLRNEDSAGVIAVGELPTFALADQIGEACLEIIEVLANPRSDHEPIGIDGQIETAVALASTNNAQKAVLGMEPHGSWLQGQLNESIQGQRNVCKYNLARGTSMGNSDGIQANRPVNLQQTMARRTAEEELVKRPPLNSVKL